MVAGNGCCEKTPERMGKLCEMAKIRNNDKKQISMKKYMWVRT